MLSKEIFIGADLRLVQIATFRSWCLQTNLPCSIQRLHRTYSWMSSSFWRNALYRISVLHSLLWVQLAMSILKMLRYWARKYLLSTQIGHLRIPSVSTQNSWYVCVHIKWTVGSWSSLPHAAQVFWSKFLAVRFILVISFLKLLMLFKSSWSFLLDLLIESC